MRMRGSIDEGAETVKQKHGHYHYSYGCTLICYRGAPGSGTNQLGRKNLRKVKK